MTDLSPKQQQAIADKIASMTLSSGLGDLENACSIAAINLALTGILTDKIPGCMSEVIGGWIIRVQDAMPHEMRNGAEWRRLLPLAAGTGRDFEKERLALILDWMWGTVLPEMQPTADQLGWGEAWRQMTAERTVEAAEAVRGAALAAERALEAGAAEAAVWAKAAARAAAEATRAARAARAAKDAADAAWATVEAVAAEAAEAATAASAEAACWAKFDPPGLLARLIEIGEVKS